MSHDSEQDRDPADKRGASLLDAEQRGGQIAQDGFDFQRAYVRILLLESLQDPAFASLLVDVAEDVEVRFDRQGRIECRAIQIKNYRVTTAKAREIVAHFEKLDLDSPGTWTGFAIACTDLDQTLKPIHNGLKLYGRLASGSFCNESAPILANTRADLERQIGAARLPVEFVLERVTFLPDLQSYKDEEWVRARALDLLHAGYPAIDRAAAEEIYLRLYRLVAESTGRLITRQQAMQIIDAVRAEPVEPVQQPPGSVGPAPDPETIAAYLRRLQTIANALPLAIIDPRAGERTRRQSMNLLPVYVALNTTTTVPVGDEPKAAKQGRHERVREAMEVGQETRALPALEAAAGKRLMVLLGDPGSGKSTFLNYLALCLAGGRLAQTGQEGAVPGHDWLGHLAPAWTHGSLLPLQVTLRRFSRSQWCNGKAAGLWAFVEETLADQGLGDFAPYLREQLMAGGVLVLLDGLDEVGDLSQRSLVRDAVTDFAATHNNGANRYLVTCRGYAYQDPCCQLDRFTVYNLAPFDQEQINRFVDCWYAEACRLGWKDEAEAGELAQLLQAASTRSDLAPLAQNPLQLAMMAALQFSWGHLPEDRVELYAEMVRLLLVRWQEGRLGRETGVTQAISPGDLESALEQVAFVAHRTQAGTQGAADISEAILLSVLKDYLGGSWDRAREMVAYIQDRAGLLIDRGNQTYTFPHRSYQEYLAGAYLAVQPDFPDQTADLVRADYGQWREVALWAVGAMARLKKMTHVAVDVAAALCPLDAPSEVTDADEWRTALLAGEALLEIGLKEVKARDRYVQVLDRVRCWLDGLVEHGALSPVERALAGNVLGRLGDPRFSGDYRLPEFIAIPGGRFWMGSDDGEVARLKAETGNDYFASEAPRHQVELDGFAIARYPTTNAMFGGFIEGGGYADERWWAEAKAARVWQPDGTVKDWIGDARRRPVLWDDVRFRSPSQPVVGVTWYEAVAYCRWLTATLADGFLYRLPTEAEWERAARGPGSASPSQGEGRRGSRYPWGDKWAEGRCNSSELGLERSTPVGIFPQGASAEGVLDLSGNVWEWCSDWYDEKEYQRRVRKAARNPAGPDSGGAKILRGGSWYNDRNVVRCACRDWTDPGRRFDGGGFRVARGSLR